MAIAKKTTATRKNTATETAKNAVEANYDTVTFKKKPTTGKFAGQELSFQVNIPRSFEDKVKKWGEKAINACVMGTSFPVQARAAFVHRAEKYGVEKAREMILDFVPSTGRNINTQYRKALAETSKLNIEQKKAAIAALQASIDQAE